MSSSIIFKNKIKENKKNKIEMLMFISILIKYFIFLSHDLLNGEINFSNSKVDFIYDYIK